MSATTDTIERAIAPILAEHDLRLYDIELSGSGRARVLRITVTDGAGRGPDIDRLAAVTRDLDPVVEEAIDGGFSLEVSSPGLERPLRRPEHFAGARGERVSVKARTESGTLRVLGTLAAVTDDAVEVLADDGTTARLELDAITSANTVFEWGPAPPPGKGSKPGAAKARPTARS